MFSRPFTDFDPRPSEQEASSSVRTFIVERVGRCIDAGQLRGDGTDVAHVLVALVQGLAAAENASRLGTTSESVDRRWDAGRRRHPPRSVPGRLTPPVGGEAALPYHAGVRRGPEEEARRPAPSIEEIEDAVVDGDRPLGAGTAMSALRHRTFRIVFLGAFASNIGTWMQNVVLGAYAYDITHSSTFVGVIIFAQLGPALLLAMVGGLIADRVDRRKFLIVLSVEQLVFSLALAWVVRSPAPSHVVLVADGGHGGCGQCHVRSRLLGHPPRARPPRRPARCHLAQLGPDERLARDRPDHRRGGVPLRGAGVGLRR